MAIARLRMKTGGAGKAGPHASYIFREGHYARDTTLERLDATETGNMPSWAQDNPVAFWRAADAHERVNGTTYREMEIAIPRELSVDDRTALVREFVAQEIGDRHAYQWAIHTPLSSSDGGEQPHVHLMFSERQVDGIERGPDQYFKRANSKAPERGGAKKGYGAHGGAWLSREDASEAMKALRGRWEGMTNDHLARAGREERIDMRSYVDRGIDITPAARLLPSAWRDDAQRSNVIAFRRAVGELVRAEEAGQVMLPDRDAQIIDLERERAKRAEVQREPVTPPEYGSLLAAARGAVMPPALAAPEIPQPSVPAPPSPDVVIQRWTAAHQRQLVAVQIKARRVMGHAEGMERRHRGRVDDHRRQEPIAPKGLLMAFKQASYETAKKAWDKVADGLWRRAQQLKLRVEKLEDYLRPIERTTLHHPGDALAYKKLEQQDPQLVKDHAQAVKAKAQEQTTDQAERKAKALESIRKQRAKENELGRDDRGRGQ